MLTSNPSLARRRATALVGFVTALTALSLYSQAQAAEPDEARADPICAPHLSPNQVLELRQGSPIRAFCDACDHILSCPDGIQALAGHPDPTKTPFIEASLHHKQYSNGEMSRCVGRHCDANTFFGAVMWDLPDAGARLQSLVDTPEKLRELSCGTKADIFKALWYVGDPAAADVMIAGFQDTACTDDHVDEILPAIASWPLSTDQQGAIATWCTDKVFTDAVDKADNIKKACSRFVAMTGAGTADTFEFARTMSRGGGKDQREAVRALGAFATQKATKKAAAKALAAILAEARRERKSGGKVKVTFLAREHTAAAAVSLLGVGDKMAKEAIASWTAIDPERAKLTDRSGFAQLAAAAPFATGKGAKAIRKVMEKAYKALSNLARTKPMYAIDQTRVAVALAQMGSNKGIDRIEDALASGDSEQIEAVLQGIGGHGNSYWGSWRTGSGGLAVGGKTGLDPKVAARLVHTLQKRRKFLKPGLQDEVSLAILDIEGRIEAASR